jgi:DNA end-binding protein Ku
MSARAIWKGVLHVGGRNPLKVPVKLYSAIQDRGIHFTMLHDQEMQPIKQKMIDTTTGDPVDREETQKGVEVEPGHFVVIRPEELEQLEPEESRDIHIEQFIPADQITHEWYERPYYLGPDGDDAAYAALAEALGHSGKEGIARWVMRKREYVGALAHEGGYLMLITLRHPDEVISSDELQAPTGRKVDAKELNMARQLVAALEDEFKPQEYHDEYRQRVMELIEKKSKGQKITLKKPVEKKPPPKSLESVLQASIEAARSGSKPKPQHDEPDEHHDEPAAPKHGRSHDGRHVTKSPTKKRRRKVHG